MFTAREAALGGADPQLPHVACASSRAELWADPGALPSQSLQQIQA